MQPDLFTSRKAEFFPYRQILVAALLTVLVLVCLPAPADAALRTWSGSGANTKWSNATNWVGNIAPASGDDLFFPQFAGSFSCNNDFAAGTTFNSLIFSAATYSVSGNSIALNAGIVATNFAQSTINNTLILNSNQTFTIDVGGGFNFAVGTSINLNGNTLTFDVNLPSTAQVQSTISGSGRLVKNGSGAASLYASNTFSGPVQLNSGNINAYHGSALGATNSGITVATNATLVFANTITVGEPISLSGTINSVGSGIVLTGPITLADTNASILVSSTTTINALISGAAGFTKGSFGTLTLNSNNTYTGLTTVNAGILIVNGSQPGSPIMLTGGALEGTGTVATVTSLGSYVSPGITTGILTCSNVTLNPSSTFQVALNGTTPGSGYSQLNVNGSVVLSNATLAAPLGFTPGLGTSFVILNNDGTDPLGGTFKNLPEGATYTNTTVPLKISYVGGSGNDVTLTFVSPPTRFDSVSQLTNGQLQLHATGGLSGFGYTLQATTNLVPVVLWSNIGTATADSNGRISFTDTNANRFSKRFYRALSP